jgi:tetratricopeptide (TPR) repeat protein
MTLDLPDHLAMLREPLAAGRMRDVIPVLEQAVYDDDPVAKLLLADCLAFDQRYADAIAVYDRAAALAPAQRAKAVLGKVTALLALDRTADAIAELDAASDLDDAELVQVRAVALRQDRLYLRVGR